MDNAVIHPAADTTGTAMHPQAAPADEGHETVVVDELIEEVSIDGMCGVY